MENLDPRYKNILKAIIDEYIFTGEPVGSKTIVSQYPFNLSAATIRNVMADLSDMGLIQKPHVSAGRQPTEKGFRFYVDSLLTASDISAKEKELIIRKYKFSSKDIPSLMKLTSDILSSLSQFVGIILAPKVDENIFKHIEFVHLHSNNYLVILVTHSGLVNNKFIAIDFDLNSSELKRMENYLNQVMGGLSIAQVRTTILHEMRKEETTCNSMINKALALGNIILSDENYQMAELFINGQYNIIDLPEFADLDKLKQLMKTLQERKKLISLLDATTNTSEIQIFIGSESGSKEISDCSLVTAKYRQDNQVLGTLGVIGPKRMDYGRIIPMVNFTAKILSKLIGDYS